MGNGGSGTTRLIVLRGSSASGKSPVAQDIRNRFGRGIAIVSQDTIRRTMLKELNQPGGLSLGLIDRTARHALAHGCHVVLEGILRADYYDVSFEETLRRHATKPQADEDGEAEMRAWYRPDDYVPGLGERCIAEAPPPSEAVERIMHESNL
jgi:predicted kinase